MKSLVLKDLYNIGHNAKSMFFILMLFAVLLLPKSGLPGYVVTCSLLCSMMIITTFSFDEQSKWVKYAMITPVSRKGYVFSKFIVLALFSLAGIVTGVLLGILGEFIFHRFTLPDASDLLALPATAFLGFVVSVSFGSISIPLLFKFGAEKARMFTLVAYAVPVLICMGIYYLLSLAGVSFTQTTFLVLLCISPFIAALWNYCLYRIACRIFSTRELLR